MGGKNDIKKNHKYPFLQTNGALWTEMKTDLRHV
jgi:hypothetical protein